MSKLARVANVECLDGYVLRLTFSDGLVRELDFDDVLVGGVLEPLREPALFLQVAVDETAGTIGWPNGIDFDPDVLHGDREPASGRRPPCASTDFARPADPVTRPRGACGSR